MPELQTAAVLCMQGNRLPAVDVVHMYRMHYVELRTTPGWRRRTPTTELKLPAAFRTPAVGHLPRSTRTNASAACAPRQRIWKFESQKDQSTASLVGPSRRLRTCRHIIPAMSTSLGFERRRRVSPFEVPGSPSLASLPAAPPSAHSHACQHTLDLLCVRGSWLLRSFPCL